jgi:hypothetical protein
MVYDSTAFPDVFYAHKRVGGTMRAHSGGRLVAVAVAGDLLAYLLATVLGFASHRELGVAALGRMAATWIPFSAAWFAIAPWLRLFDPARLRGGPHLSRVVLAALIAAPIGAWLRSLWLGSNVVAIFVLVMAAATTALMLLWRGLLGIVVRRSEAKE